LIAIGQISRNDYACDSLMVQLLPPLYFQARPAGTGQRTGQRTGCWLSLCGKTIEKNGRRISPSTVLLKSV